MKKSLLILALPLLQLAASSAFAASHTAAPMTSDTPATSATSTTPMAPAMTKSRAEVKSETKAAASNGAAKPGEVGSPSTFGGKVVAPVGNDQTSTTGSGHAMDDKDMGTKSRSEVKAGAIDANQKEVHRKKGDNMKSGK